MAGACITQEGKVGEEGQQREDLNGAAKPAGLQVAKVEGVQLLGSARACWCACLRKHPAERPHTRP